MNNPGINSEIWERLRKKWTELEKSGYKIKIDFQLIASANDEKNILAIDVIQKINDDITTETVQRNVREAYETLGIAGLSMEQLVGVYKKVIQKLYHQLGQKEMELVVIMSPSSSIAGEVRGYLESPHSDLQSSVLVGYHHYYVMNALREKMIESLGDGWKQVKAVYYSDALEFYFEY